MSDSQQFTEVTTQGWLSRLGGGLVAALIGLILVPVSIGVLYWNEGRAITAIRALESGSAAIVEVSATAIDPQTNGKLVHVSGTIAPTTAARDPMFGVTADGLLRLSRTVEMYQWKEETKSQSQQNIGGSQTTETTTSYSQVWSAMPIASAQFKKPEGHQNPPMPAQAATFDGSDVKLGVYRIDQSLLAKVNNFSPLQVGSPPPSGYQAADGGFFRGQDPSQPAIGDVKVSFSGVSTQTVSVAGGLSGGALSAYRDASGYTIALAEPGVVSASALFHDEQKSEGRLTWILRGVGFVVMLIGFLCMTRPLTLVFAVLPFLELLAGAGAFLVALTLSIPITLLTIAIAWIAHRPLIGILLLVGAAAALYLLRRLHPRRPAVASPQT